MGYKLTRESSIPDKRYKSIANPELLEAMREFYKSDMDIASIKVGADWKKTSAQATYYSNKFFDSRIKTAVRGGKIYLKKI